MKKLTPLHGHVPFMMAPTTIPPRTAKEEARKLLYQNVNLVAPCVPMVEVADAAPEPS